MEQKGDLTAFQLGMIDGARRAGLSMKDTAVLLGFSRATVSKVCKDWSGKDKTSNDRQFCGRKTLVDEKGQRKMARLIQSDRKATVKQLTARYNQGMQRCISERTTRRILKQMGYSKQKTTIVTKEQPEDIPVSEDQETAATVSAETPELNETPSTCPQEEPEASL